METEEARLYELQNAVGVDVKLGQMMIKRNMKIGDVVTKWDKDFDGSVSKTEFRTCVGEMGVTAEAAEVDALFDSLDADGGGDLSLNELKPTLKRLLDSATGSETEIKELTKSTKEVRKAAKQQQASVVTAQAKEDREAKEAEEEARKAEEAKVAAEAEAKAAKKAAAAEKAAAKEEEKQAFDAKIAERRKAKGAS